MLRNRVWDRWSSNDDEDDAEDDRSLALQRRQYKMFERIDFDRWDDKDFFARFRLRKDTVAFVLEIIRPSLEYNQDRLRYIKPVTQLLLVLRFYAIGNMQLTIGDFAGVSQLSVSKILQRVSTALACQARRFIKMPRSDTERMAASREFYLKAKFPRCIGAIDCTHIKIQSPGGEHAENFRNRKAWFSLNVQIVASVDLKVCNIVARWPGASHDQTIFNNCVLKMQLERGDFGRFLIVGDSGYRNTSYLATPFLACNTPAEALYNESQIRTRNPVERLNGVLKRRFPVLAMGMRVKMETIQKIIVACAVLHNIAIDSHEKEPPPLSEEFEQMIASTEVPVPHSTERSTSDNVRAQLVDTYFSQLLVNESQ